GGWEWRNSGCGLDPVVPVRDLAVVGGLQEDPGLLADRLFDELDVAVGEAGVDPAGVTAAGLGRHAVVVRALAAAHAVPRADARIPEAVAALDLVRLVEAVGRGRAARAAGADDARPRHAHRPGAGAVGAAHADPHFVEEERLGGAVRDVGEPAAVIDRHDRPLDHSRVGRVRDAVVAPDV